MESKVGNHHWKEYMDIPTIEHCFVLNSAYFTVGLVDYFVESQSSPVHQ